MAAVREAITAALAGGKTLVQADIAEATGLTDKQVAQALSQMAKSGALLRTGKRGHYEFSASDRTPPPKGTGKKKKNKAARAGTTRGGNGKANRAARSAPPENEETETDFAITGGAALSITQGDTTLILGPFTFERLRDFINRTCPIWDPDGKA